MSKSRKNWGEGFVLGLLIGIATIACLSGRPAVRSTSPSRAGIPPVRLTRKSLRDAEATRYLADLPAASSAVH